MFWLMRNSLLKYLCCPIILKLVFVPFRSLIKFHRLLSEVLLNCILRFYKRKDFKGEEWVVGVKRAGLDSFPILPDLVYGHCILVELHTRKISHSAILNTLSVTLWLLLFLFCCMFKIHEDTCIIKYYLKVCWGSNHQLCPSTTPCCVVVCVVFLCTPLWLSVLDYQMADRDLGLGIFPAWGQSSGISRRNHSSTEKPQSELHDPQLPAHARWHTCRRLRAHKHTHR